MAYKMKGSSFYGKNGKSPAKQLKEQYMRTPQEKEFYSSSASKDYEPVPMGTYRGPGAYSKYTGEDEKFDFNTNTNPRKKGDTVAMGMPSGPKKKKGTSKKTGPAESAEMIAKKKKLAMEETKGPSGTIFDASDADMDRDQKERKDYRESQKYIKTK